MHDKKFYPNPKNNFAETPEAQCIFEDTEGVKDMRAGRDGCQRSYFRAMSKAMAMKCSGEIFMMTNFPLHKKEYPEDFFDEDDYMIEGHPAVPEGGIWWDSEFPTLFDPKRPDNVKVTKVSLSTCISCNL